MRRIEQEGVEIVAKLMAVAARTAPKTGGADWIKTMVATEEEKKAVAAKMLEVADIKAKAIQGPDEERSGALRMDWGSDAGTVERSNLLMLFGVQGRKVTKLDCGGCGYQSCAEMCKKKPFSKEEKDFPGPFCIFRVMDLSIAVASAVKIAMDFNVDNRMMQKIGIAALKLGLLNPCDLVLGVPLSVSGKNIFFDRADKIDAWKILGNVKK
ncbi:ferredoxin domain-containing protein [Thermodesulfobacteriota bacterium]